MTQFNDHLTFLREEFFNFYHPDHLRWSLPACIVWANPEQWIHEASRTLEGGRYGIKWPILLLIFIQVTAVRFNLGQRPVYSMATEPTISSNDIAQLNAMVVLWEERLADSLEILLQSINERRLPAPISSLTVPVQRPDAVAMLKQRTMPSEWDVRTVFLRLNFTIN